MQEKLHCYTFNKFRGVMDKQLLKMLKKKREKFYNDKLSISKKYDDFLEKNGIYHSLNEQIFFNSIKGKKNLCEFTLQVYHEANYDNEKDFLLDCLLHMGYDRNSLTELVLSEFKKNKQSEYLWHYADFLYYLKNYLYMDDYLDIISDSGYGSSREMLILLVGESKKESVIPYLIKLSNEENVIGHVLVALSQYDDDRVISLMTKFADYPKTWISEVAKKYIKNH